MHSMEHSPPETRRIIVLSVLIDHEFLQLICKFGEAKLRIQRWMEFVSANNLSLS